MRERDVDILVGAQYGDEGKGMVCKLLADRATLSGPGYTWTGRVGAQNAEHRFVHEACEFCARVLPSASAYRNILAILGAGHCFYPPHLLLEAKHLGVSMEQIYLDPHAMWLRPEHAGSNLEIGNKRGTTGWGIGAAIAEKVRRKPETRLIGECPEMVQALGDHLTSVPVLLEQVAGLGLIEGSQGTMLSLNHGHYPYCTAKDVTAPAIAAEMGIAPRRIRKVFGAARLVFMRVPGQSGPTGGREVSYQEVEARTGLRLPQHKRLQGDSMLWKASGSDSVVEEERLFDYSMEELRYSHYLNGFDYLAITFADYHRPGNYRVTRWTDLHEDTKRAIRNIEETLGVPVCLVRTGQGEHDNIWLMDPFAN